MYISPDADIARIPFDGLLSNNNRFLLQDWNISYLVSGRELADTDRARSVMRKVVVFANPDLPHPPYELIPETEKEGLSIKKTLPNVELHLGAEATGNALREVNDPSILHLATHGYSPSFDELTPSSGALEDIVKKKRYGFLRSGVILSKEKSLSPEQQDDIVTSFEVALLNLSDTGLVVLSACGSGLGDTTPGDNLSGLRSAVQMAGAQASISSLWKENDIAGEQLIGEFYSGLSKQGTRGAMSIADSLRHAKLLIMQRAEYRNPYFWALFVFEGKDQTLNF